MSTIANTLTSIIKKDDKILKVGSKIEAQYKGKSKWIAGKIIKTRSDGTYDISYDNGKSEKGVKQSLIRSKNDEDAKSMNDKKSEDEENSSSSDDSDEEDKGKEWPEATRREGGGKGRKRHGDGEGPEAAN